MDLQKLIDTISEACSRERANYHMTLGELVELLETFHADVPVIYDIGGSPSAPVSYRGYYIDLSFPPVSEPISAATLLLEATDAIGRTFTGYKGGDFTMHDKTPLWASPYGSASGMAIIGHRHEMNTLILTTKQIY